MKRFRINKQNIAILLCILVFIVLILNVSLNENLALGSGNVYYVALDGNDSNDGLSVDTAWRTIDKANRNLQAGDTVYVRGGTYNEIIEPWNSGTEGEPITYMNYNGENVKIRGSEDKDWTLIAIGRKVRCDGLPRQYITIDGFTFDHEFTNKPGYRCQVGVISDTGTHDIIIRNCEMYGHGPANENDDPTIRDGGMRIQKGPDHIIIENCYADGWLRSIVNIGQSSENSDVPKHIIIRNNEFHHSWGALINLGSSTLYENKSILVENNILNCSLIGDGFQFENNYAIDCSDYTTKSECDASPCYWSKIRNQCYDADSNRGVVIRGNIITNCAENAIDMKGGAFVLIEDNTIYNCPGNNDGGFPLHNTQGNNRGGGVGGVNHGSGCSMRNIIVRNNVIYDNKGGGLAEDGTIYYNNLIANNDYDYTGSNSDYENPSKPVFCGIRFNGYGSKRIACKNNIFFGHSHGDIAVDSDDLDDFDIDGNLYHDSILVNFRDKGDFDYLTFDEWKQFLTNDVDIKGNDVHSIWGDPKLKNVPLDVYGDHENWDFDIEGDSPCIDGGVHLTVTTSSGSGNSVPVEESLYFFGGAEWDSVEGDLLKIGDDEVRLTDVNYCDNLLVLERQISWDEGDKVSLAYKGESMDIGPYDKGGFLPDIPMPQVPGFELVVLLSSLIISMILIRKKKIC